jgi:hypothetical protein
MCEWQPIKDAPKDGTKVDLWQDGRRYTDVFWSFSRNAAGQPIYDPVWDGWAWDGVVGQSYTPNYIPDSGRNATHFMLLPEAPK